MIILLVLSTESYSNISLLKMCFSHQGFDFPSDLAPKDLSSFHEHKLIIADHPHVGLGLGRDFTGLKVSTKKTLEGFFSLSFQTPPFCGQPNKV